MRFEQTWRTLDIDPLTATAAEIEAEPMFYNATRGFLNGDRTPRPLTGRFFGALIDECIALGDDFSLDTRSHMLMRGWLPAIPGWHHDDVDRAEHGQPDYDKPLPANRIIYVVALDASDAPTGSMTEFARSGEPVDVTWPVPADEVVYRYWDHELRTGMRLNTTTLQSGQIAEFGAEDFHRAMPAMRSGWRWFARLTINPGPRDVEPKIRRQAQVYLPVTNAGW